MLGHLRLPLRQTSPRSNFPNFVGRTEKRACICDGSAADRAAVENGGVPEETHVEKTAQTELRPPEPAMNGPARAGKRKGRPSAPHLEHGNSITFFHQPERRNAASEAGSDDNKVEIELRFAYRHAIPLAEDRVLQPKTLCDLVFAGFDDSLCDGPPQGHHVERVVFTEPAQNCQL